MFDQYVAFQARCRPGRPAVVGLDETVSFQRFDAHINSLAYEFRDLPRDSAAPVSVAVADPYMHWVAVLALARCGIASAPSGDTGSFCTIADGDGRAPADALRISSDMLARTLPHQPRRVQVDPDALGRVAHSSGTTGARKRIGISWRIADARIRNALLDYGAPPGSWWALTGLNTGLGFHVALAAWASGNAARLDTELRVEDFLRLKPVLAALAPAQLRILLDRIPEGTVDWPLTIISGGGAITPDLARQTRRALTSDLRSAYGASETGAIALGDLDTFEAKGPGATGYILPKVEVQIRDEEGRPLEPGATGRVWIRSERVVENYLGGGGGGSSAFKNGWFSPGDIGRVEEDGLLFLDGRADDLMNIGGHKFLPAWIEEPVLACPGVLDAAAFTVAGRLGLPACHLAIVRDAKVFREADLRTALVKRVPVLGEIKIIFLARIPRNDMGKIDRKRLAAMVAA